MKKLALALGTLLILALTTPAALADEIALFEYALNVPAGAGIDLSGFDAVTGLGIITITLSTAGPNTVLAFFDHEIDEETNTFFNEYGSTSGTPAAGQSWEIDEPGYVFGNIYANFLAGALDNSNGVPAGSPDDVSMAIGWLFSLNAGEMAVINFIASRDEPVSGFYLQHTDPDSNTSIYLYSNIAISPVGVPEPGMLLLLALGLSATGAAGAFRKRA
ncbi:MAG: PEP-CTERM sorting domain-containing protein [Acidobacteria bacterium]|nr:PEP-CTERM sorting domain-containing protein [Acidobacteriota bacterium]